MLGTSCSFLHQVKHAGEHGTHIATRALVIAIRIVVLVQECLKLREFGPRLSPGVGFQVRAVGLHEGHEVGAQSRMGPHLGAMRVRVRVRVSVRVRVRVRVIAHLVSAEDINNCGS